MLSHTVSLRYTHDIHMKEGGLRNKCIAYSSDGSLLLLLLEFKLQFFISIVKPTRCTIFEFTEYHSKCFGRSFRPSSGVQICTYTIRYTGCNRRNGPDFGKVFLRSNYTDITPNTYIQSSMVTEILAREV